MRDGKLSINRVKIIPIRINLLVVDRDQDIAFLDSTFGRRSTLIDLVDVHSAIGILKLQIMPKLRISGRGEAEAGTRKALIWLALGFDQEMFNHRARNSIDRLGPAIVSHQKCRQLVPFNDWKCETVFSELQRATHAEH